MLAGLWAQIDGDHLVAEFELLATDTQLQARRNLSEEGTPRLTLPFERVRSGLSQTRTQTKVNRCLTEGRARLREMQPAVLT